MKIVYIFFILVIQVCALNISDIKSKDSLYKYINYEIGSDEYIFTPETKNLPQKQLDNSNFGNISSSVYTILDIKNNTSDKKQFILKNPRAGVDEINSYVMYSDKPIEYYNQGDNYSIKNRPIKNRYSTLLIELNPNERVQIYSQYKTMGSMEVDWVYYNLDDFEEENLHESIFLGFITGVVFALSVYNLTMFFSIRDKIYILYVLIAISFIVHQLCLKGVLYILTSSDGNFLSKLIYLVALSVSYFTLWFNIEFFNIKKTQSKLYVLIYITMFLTLIYSVLFLIFYETNYGILFTRNVGVIFLIGSILVIYSSFYYLVKDFRNAILYILGQLIFIIFAIIQYVMLIGIINHNFFLSKYGNLVGVVVDLVFISIALGNRIKMVNIQKIKNEKLALINSRYTSIGKLLGNISHQWKNPLIDLSAYLMKIETAYNMKPEVVNNVLKESLPQMNKTLQFMGNSVDEFNNLARIDREKQQFKLDEIIDDLKGLLSARLSLNNGKIVYTSNTDISINGYPLALSQVFIIFIENSLDAAKRKNIENPTIKIEAKYEKQKTIIHIEDNCGGVSTEPIEKIFEIFETSKINSNSSGVGLQIAKMIIEEQFKGELNVCNINHGARFTIILIN